MLPILRPLAFWCCIALTLMGPRDTNAASAVTKAVTDLADPLHCLDRLLAAGNGPGLAITTDGLIDASGSYVAGSRDTISSALSAMSASGRALRIFDHRAKGQSPSGLLRIRGSVGPTAPSRIELSIVEHESREVMDDATITMVMDKSGRIMGLDPPFDPQAVSLPGGDRPTTADRHRANLIGMATLAMIGRVTGVPYWRCIGFADDHPAARAESHGSGFGLARAIGGGSHAAAEPVIDRGGALTLLGKKELRRGERLRLLLSSVEEASAHCYYRDGMGRISRIFPNRFQPSAKLPAGSSLTIPSDAAGFEIVAEDAGSEEVTCMSAPGDALAQIPASITGADLEPLDVPSMDQVLGLFQLLAGERLRVARLPIRIR